MYSLFHLSANPQARFDSENADITLHCAGVPLSDELCVSELTSDVLEMTVPLVGGKVHGSLARAGKVKGQTPKVNINDDGIY